MEKKTFAEATKGKTGSEPTEDKRQRPKPDVREDYSAETVLRVLNEAARSP